MINAGTVAAFFLVRQADKVGRRRMLTITIAGYTVFTFLTGFAPEVWSFTAAQFLARIFLVAEWAVSMVIAAEEFPAARRGMTIGVIQAFGSLGSIACAGLVPVLLKTSYGWRSVYFVGIVPLVILAFARRGLRETERFEKIDAATRARSLFYIWTTPHRKRVLQLALVWGVTYVAAQNALAFWKEFAIHERGFSDGEVGLAISIAAVLSMPLIFYAGALLDAVGRRRGAAIIYGISAVGTVGCYTLEGFVPLTAVLVLGIFAVSAYLPVLNAYTSELVPTHVRGDAFAWSNNLLGRITYVASPFLVGHLVGEVGEFGPVIAWTAVFPILALVLILAMFPETRHKELEETSAV